MSTVMEIALRLEVEKLNATIEEWKRKYEGSWITPSARDEELERLAGALREALEANRKYMEDNERLRAERDEISVSEAARAATDLLEIERLRAEVAARDDAIDALRMGYGRPSAHPEIERLRAEVETHWNNLSLAQVENERLRAQLAGVAEAQELRATEIRRLRAVFADAKAAVESDLTAMLADMADDDSAVAEAIRCHLDRWACWGPSRRHISLDRA